MADESSPVVRQQRLFNGTNSGNSVTGLMVVDGSQSDHHLPHSDDDELSVGGTTPPPQPLAVEEQFKEEHLDDIKVDDSVGPSLIKFSIDNILNPEFGVRMNAAESAAAAVALHHHQQLIQQHHSSPAAAAAAAGFLGAFHQIPFLAAARQMILAAASGGSSIDYNHHHHLAAVAAAQHAVPNSLLLPHQHATNNTLNLVQSCTDKYLGSSSKQHWGSHQPALPSGVGGNRSVSQVGVVGSVKGALRSTAAAQQVTNLNINNNDNKSSVAALGKAIDLSVRNSASPPDHRHHQLHQKQRLSVIGDKPSTFALQVVSPSLASGSSNDDNSSAHSPTRSVSVGGSTCSVGNGESGSGSTGQQASAGSGGEAGGGSSNGGKEPLWPAWVYCTRYSDRPSSGRSPRARRIRSKKDRKAEEKRPRTAFTSEQLARLKTEFTENRYLTEKRRQDLARELQLHENQIKIWFQNKRAKIKKASGQKNPLALQLMAQGLYNHSTMALDEDEEDDDDMLQNPE